MDVKRIMPFLIPTRGKISKLVSEILTLEQKLINIDEQSSYFKEAHKNHLKRHQELLDRYDIYRFEFKSDDLYPRTAEHLGLKRFTDELPIFKILREDAEILRDILPENRQPYFLDDYPIINNK